MVEINRRRVRHSFDRHAGQYEEYAFVQKRVVDRFIELLRDLAVYPRRVLDVGAGTGKLLGNLIGLYPAADLVGLDLAYGMSQVAQANLAEHHSTACLTGDAESLPFIDRSYDLVVSTSALQWVNSLDGAFSEAFRVLVPGGRFVFAIFGERTLFELRGSYRKAWEQGGHGREERTHTFHALSEVNGALGRTGFLDAHAHSELEIERHPDVLALLGSIRKIGAGNAAAVKSHGFAERRVMLDMMDNYRRDYAAGGLIPATYEVIYGWGRKGAS